MRRTSGLPETADVAAAPDVLPFEPTGRKKPRPRVIGEDDLLTTQQVSALLNVTTHTVRGLIYSGQLPAVRVARLYRVWRSDLQRFLDVNTVGR